MTFNEISKSVGPPDDEGPMYSWIENEQIIHEKQFTIPNITQLTTNIEDIPVQEIKYARQPILQKKYSRLSYEISEDEVVI